MVPTSDSISAGRGKGLGELPQTEDDLKAGMAALEGWVTGTVVEDMDWDQALGIVTEKGVLVRISFVVWQGDGIERKARLALNFKEQSGNWLRGSVRMESLESFAEELRQGDRLIAFDVKSGYHHFGLHPAMRDWFLFRYENKCYRCIALPFGWGRSVWWFYQLLKPFTGRLREMRHRTFP
jgi:hypothetical protein